jgi:hypothetical protein
MTLYREWSMVNGQLDTLLLEEAFCIHQSLFLNIDNQSEPIREK